MRARQGRDHHEKVCRALSKYWCPSLPLSATRPPPGLWDREFPGRDGRILVELKTVAWPDGGRRWWTILEDGFAQLIGHIDSVVSSPTSGYTASDILPVVIWKPKHVPIARAFCYIWSGGGFILSAEEFKRRYISEHTDSAQVREED